MNNTISVSVLGVAGSGKTSCLVSMLDHIKKDFFDNVNLRFSLDSHASKLLIDQRAKLVASLEKGAMEASNGIKPTQEISKYSLKLGKKGTQSALPMTVEFIDYPGGWLTNGNSANLSQVKEFVAKSEVLIIPIDAAYLMEMKDDPQSDIVLNILKEVYDGLQQPRLVILTPVKCEKYYGSGDSNLNKAYHTLLMKIQEKYEHVISFLSGKTLKKSVSIVIIPMQTLGSCKLMYFSENDKGVKTPVFVVTQRGVYAPKNTEQPFLYLISFILKSQYESRNTGLSGLRRRLFKSHNYLKTTSEEMSQLCLNNGGIRVIQNSRITTF